jgi:lipoprotein-anchoring transpeptidase ErfK/SrfK
MPDMAGQRTDVRGRRAAPRTRLRYLRISAAGGSLLVTLVALLGGVGILPTNHPATAAASDSTNQASSVSGGADGAVQLAGSPTSSLPKTSRDHGTSNAPRVPVLPASSGSGRRIVFDMTAQRVWLVNAAGKVKRTYLVSGSVTDNLKPGSYAVYSRSVHALGVDNSGTMQYMVRFTQGHNAAIGFHDIPIKDGKLVQTRGQLGTPESHGCIRQWRPDAKALWNFAPIGTTVDVLA